MHKTKKLHAIISLFIVIIHTDLINLSGGILSLN